MENIINLNGLMYGTSITEFDVSKWETSNIKDMSYMFYGCSNLTSIIGIENLVSNTVTNISYMFHSCTSLEYLDLSNWDISNITSLTFLCYNCKSLTDIILSE